MLLIKFYNKTEIVDNSPTKRTMYKIFDMNDRNINHKTSYIYYIYLLYIHLMLRAY